MVTFHTRHQRISWRPSFVPSLLLVLLCVSGLTRGGIVHHEPGEIQSSFNLFNLLNNYVGPQPPTNRTTQATVVTDCPPNVIFVIDASGSISFSGFDTAKQAVIREIRALTATFAQVDIGIVQFSENNYVIPIKSRTPAELEDLIREIQALTTPRLGTELNEAIREARRAVAVHSTMADRALNGDKSGNILVLFTDGQVTPAVESESAKEVQTAQNQGILVLIDTVEEPSQTVHNIAPTVLESRTPINWVDYVACPPKTLDRPPKGSACRDFYMVVDGSDSVLRMEGTLRLYLSYTALRYQNTDNAIGVNLYGTDTNRQARNTRIRLTEDKYELADDIRQELTFPRSRGAGTGPAVMQSIGFLNDDIRDKPAALVLIMVASPLDLQATAQAIGTARQQGYPVVIIRIGQVSNAEMSQLANGDMRGVYNIDYVTDLFGVDFDDFLCGGGTGCNLTPQSCVGPRVFQQSSCSCVCANSCAVGRTHGPNCQCQCDGRCPPGQSFNNDCLCRCSNTCPAGTRQNRDCSCTTCPNRCQNNQFQDPNCACQCRNACPQFQHTDATCGCVCDLTNQPPDARGFCADDRQCQLTQQECGFLELDFARCQCGPRVRCPPDAVNVGQTGNSCRCNNVNQVYNPSRNLCECPNTCPTGQTLVTTTCECDCAARCPSGQYNNPGTNCQCFCNNTNQPPVNGACVVPVRCPTNSVPVGTSCRCNDPAFTYNQVSNTCVRNCPANAILRGNTCECTQTNKRFDPTRNECVCRTSCPSGSVQNTQTCACSCLSRCPTGQYNTPDTNCRCLCTGTDQQPVNGRCLVCPSGSQPVGTTCQCTDNAFVYDTNTNTCVRRCPIDANPNGNTCLCTNTNKIYDVNSNRCVCQRACPTGLSQDPSTCTCSCQNQCPTGQIPSPGSGCSCVCSNTNQPPVGGVCLQCPFNAQQVGASCQCIDPAFTYNSVTNTCVRRCPNDANPNGNTCRCTNNNKRYDITSNRCVCQRACPTGLSQDPSTCTCSCQNQCPTGQIPSPGSGCSCVCSNTNQPPVGGVCLQCPNNAQQVGASCQCIDPAFTYNSVTNTCVRRCPNDANPNGNTCRCTNNNKRYDITSNRCVCQRACPTGLSQDPSTCTCSCQNQCPTGQIPSPGSGCSCVCSNTNQPPVGGVCLQCPNNAQQVGASCQCIDPAFTYNSVTNTCVRRCPNDANPNGNTCRCTNNNKRYDITSNRCVCQRACPTGLSQDPSTCTCSCQNQCPTGQIPSPGSGCSCVCSNTNQPPVGGVCLQCPNNAQQVGASCQCIDPAFTYNSVTNTCVRRCPNDANPNGNTCRCTNNNKRYDITSNRCVCQRACPTGLSQDPSTCTCSCQNQCPTGQIPSPGSGCSCVCSNTNQPPVGGVCLQCPNNAQQVGASCQCIDPAFTYNSVTNTCVRGCPVDATRFGNTCQCTSGNKTYDFNSNMCVCTTTCPSGSILDSQDCECHCSLQCHTGQYNSPRTNCQCLCTNTDQPPVNGQCFDDRQCQLTQQECGFLELDFAGCRCGPRVRCPPDAVNVGQTGNSCRCNNVNQVYNPSRNLCECPNTCPTGQTLVTTTCECDCAARCPSGQYNNPGTNCQCLCSNTNNPPVNGACVVPVRCPANSLPVGTSCRCNDPAFTYNQVSNTCVRNCPTNAILRGNTCECTQTNKRFDPTRNECVCRMPCQSGSAQNTQTCACSCLSQCPTGQYNTPETNCRCLCTGTNQEPVNGRCLVCPSGSQRVGTTCQCTDNAFVYDTNTNTCVRRCPNDATRNGNTCRCTNTNKRYDVTSNRCVCRLPCQSGSAQNTQTCACSCVRQCPTGQYNTLETNCMCLCTGTNQAPVNGRCLVCPSGSQRVGTTCQCTDNAFVYDTNTNTCVRRCPNDATRNGNTCRCTNTNKRYDVTSNRCVCRLPCQSGSAQNTQTCACSCLSQCPTGQYNTLETNCRCLCTGTNQAPVNGRCLVCPSGSQRVGTTCQCTDNAFVYDTNTNTCVRRCPNDATRNGNTCRCTNTNKRYDVTSNRCVCRLPCQSGSAQNTQTCACSCLSQCPTGQYNTLETNCRCLCTGTNQAPVNGRCLVCPSGSQRVGTTCQCTDNAFVYDTNTNTCVRRCPNDATRNGNTCRCTNTNKRYDVTSNRCVCRLPCQSGSAQNTQTCACSCLSQCPTGQYNTLETNCRCLCTGTNQAPVNGRCLVCPSGSQRVGTTCQCTDNAFVYDTNTNTCVRRCPNDATRNGNTCRCTNTNKRYDVTSNRCVCTTTCPSGSILDSQDCECHCSLQCHTGQYNNPRTNCQCLCRNTDQPPVNGQCFDDRQCQLTQQECGFLELNFAQCQCGPRVRCPSDAVNVGPTGSSCRCNNVNQVYNPNRNLCECSTTCPTGQTLVMTTCECNCAARCPSGQYNNPGTNCQCLCSNTNQPPVNGACVVPVRCPANAVSVGTSCRCNDPAFTYNQVSNTCVRNCPANAILRGNTCECRETNKRFDPTRNECVCRTACPSGSVANTQTCSCSCVSQCPTGQYNTPATNCRCLCTGTNQQPVNGRCLVCPSGSQPVGTTCRCTNNAFLYDPNTNTCVRRCPNDATPNGNTCQCTNTNKRYDVTSNRCVCQRTCSTGLSQDPSTCTCSCRNQCPSGQIPSPGSGCSCVCTNTNQPPVGGVCLQCPNNARQVGASCQCIDSAFTYNSVTNTCVRGCPVDATRSGNTCQCTSGNKRYDSNSNTCVCNNRCPTGSILDSQDCECHCSLQCHTGQYNTPATNCRCLCTGTNQQPVNGRCLVCPSGSQPVGTTCRCTNNAFLYDPNTNTCVRRCPNDATPNGNTCQCTNTNKRYDVTSNRCVCQRTCSTGLSQDPSTCTCSCRNQCPSGQIPSPGSGCSCVCTNTNQPPVGGVCLQCPNNARQVGASCQCIDSAFTYNSVTNTCVRGCPVDATRSGNTCQCTSGNKRYDSNSNTCVCNNRCPTGSILDSQDCECHCSLQCHTGQYNNPRTNCQCLCRNTDQPPVNGQCFSGCPSDASSSGNTCQCNEQNKRYDATNNRCVCNTVCPAGSIVDPASCECACTTSCPSGQYNFPGAGCTCLCQNTNQPPVNGVCFAARNCPIDANPSGNTCLCTNTNKRYDPNSNSCVCRSSCSVPGSVQNSNTCACSCATGCPSGQYKNLQTGCRCLCQLDNSEPLGGFCSNRVGGCNLKPSDCVAPQVPNMDPRICRCENPSGQLCSESEWSCANGRPAYRDCHGACVCDCSTQFAGPRCEITVNSTLCDHCHYFQGIYKAGIPGFCDMYVNCHPVEGAGQDERGRPRAFTATIQACPPGTYYVVRPDGYEVCNWLRAGTCYGDPCNDLPPNARYADESACQRYWQCGPDRQLTGRECCPAGQGFDPNTQQCVDNPSCPDSCGPCETNTPSDVAAPRKCQLAPVPGNRNQYYRLSNPTVQVDCDANQVYSATACSCVSQIPVDTGPMLCVPTFQDDFEGPSHYEDNVPRVSFQGQQVGQFRGKDDRVIKAFADSGFHTDYFQIDFRINLDTMTPPSGGQRMAVVTNADCETEESISITMDGTNFYFRIVQMGSTSPAEITIPYSGLADSNGWYRIRLVYTGRRGQFQFTASVGSQSVTYQGPVGLINYIDRRRCALHLGFGYNYVGFQGYFDDMKVWRCQPT